MTTAQPFDARLVRTRVLTPSVRELTFERADGGPLEFQPGQWLNLLLPDPSGEGERKRAYSIASPPDLASPRFELAVTRVEGGAGSTHLHALREGALVRAVGPFGVFTRAPTDGRASLFVGTGTGLTPLRSMVRAALAQPASEPLVVLLGVRREADILYGDEFEELARRHPKLRFEVTLSQPSETWSGRRGYVQAHLEELARSMPEPQVYVCGLDRMVSAVRDQLRGELGFDRKRVHTERYD